MAILSRIVLILGLAGVASSNNLKNLRHEGLVRALEFSHRLRVCNAYPNSAPLEVYRGNAERLTGDGAMPYKSCKDLPASLKSGDRLEFKVGETSAGSFSVENLPDNDAVMMLVVTRHDTASTAMSFESHVFGNMENAQVAIIDAYKGKARASPHIRDQKSAKGKRNEELRFDSVVAVNQGAYDVELDGPEGGLLSKHGLVALNRESYVVLRTGVESKNGQSFPEELVVFPQSDRMALPHSGAAPSSTRLATVGAMAMAALFAAW